MLCVAGCRLWCEGEAPKRIRLTPARCCLAEYFRFGNSSRSYGDERLFVLPVAATPNPLVVVCLFLRAAAAARTTKPPRALSTYSRPAPLLSQL